VCTVNVYRRSTRKRWPLGPLVDCWLLCR